MLSPKSLFLLLASVAALFIAAGLKAPAWLVFGLSAVAMLPLGTALGRASEDLAHRLGPGPGALLNATFGNAPELVILFFTLQKGMLDMVKATIAGALLTNLLLVIGLASVVGGLRYKMLKLHPLGASFNLGTLSLVVAALLLPAVFANLPHPAGGLPLAERIEELSLGAAAALLAIYGMSLLFMFWTHSALLNTMEEEERERPPASIPMALLWLAGCVVLVVLVSDRLVDATEHLVVAHHLPPLFMGVVGLACVGNIADYTVAVTMAWRNKVDLAFRIATGAAIQVALFVAPMLVILSRFTAHPLDLNFTPLEVLSVGLAVFLVRAHSEDNAFTWFEGAQLIALYLIIAMGFFFY